MMIIRLILETLNISQQDFADKIGVSRQTVYMWLSGYKISERHLQKISEVYLIPMSFLQKSQISGFQLSEKDYNYLREILINNIHTYNENVIKMLLNVINTKNCFLSTNYSDFINMNLDYTYVDIINNITEALDETSNFLVICECYKKGLDDIVAAVDNVIALVGIMRVAYIIINSNRDKMTIIKFGGKNETAN